MDILLSEISNKRKDLADPAGSSRPQKYMRKADIERAKEDEAKRKREAEEQKKKEEALAKEKDKVRLRSCHPRWISIEANLGVHPPERPSSLDP